MAGALNNNLLYLKFATTYVVKIAVTEVGRAPSIKGAISL